MIEKALLDIRNDFKLHGVSQGNLSNGEFTEDYTTRLERVEQALVELERLTKALDYRNEEEGKAHALFTDALSDGTRVMHTPDTCNPLGFVKLLRERVEKELSANKDLQSRLQSSELRERGLRTVLDRLARLGNEPQFGNSQGNIIAQEALSTPAPVDEELEREFEIVVLQEDASTPHTRKVKARCLNDAMQIAFALDGGWGNDSDATGLLPLAQSYCSEAISKGTHE